MRVRKRLVGLFFIMVALNACLGLGKVNIEKGDERPFEKPLSVSTAPNRLAIGYAVSVGIKEDGTLWSWGTNLNGTLGDGREGEQRLMPTQISGMADFVEISGDSHFLALKKDGTVWSWGDNSYGQLGYEVEPDKLNRRFGSVPRKISGLQKIISVAAGLGHSLALDNKGNVFAFGSNRNQQLGIYPKDSDRHVSPMMVYTRKDAVRVSAHGGKSVLLTENGEVVYWGGNSNKAVSEDDVKSVVVYEVTPTQLKIPEKCSEFVMSGSAVFCLASDGFVWAKGWNDDGKLGQGDFLSHIGFVRVKNIGRVVNIVSDGLSVAALDESGSIWQWGQSVRWPQVAGAIAPNVEPYPIKRSLPAKPIKLAGGKAYAALTENGAVYYWGGAKLGTRGTGKPSQEHQSAENWMSPELSLWKWK